GRLETVLRGHQRAVRSIAFAPDGGRLASAGEDGSVRVFRCAPPPGLAVLPHGPWATMAARFDGSGRLLVTCAAGATARVWDGAPGEFAREVDHGAAITCAVFDDRRHRLLTAGRDGAIAAWDPGTGERLDRFVLPGGPDDHLHLLLDHRGDRLLVTTA